MVPLMEETRPSYMWDWETVRTVSGIIAHGRFRISAEARLLADKSLLKLEIEQVKRSLLDQIRTHGVEADPRDFDFRTTECVDAELGHAVHVIDAHWWPTTNAVLVFGGSRDGEIWAVRGAPHQPIVIEEPVTLPARPTDYHNPLMDISLRTTIWNASGWHEQRRCWIYTREAGS